MDGRLFDGQVVRPPDSFRQVASQYICVRITNINQFDIRQFEFDYDLTLAFVIANPDGTVYHRYGGRDTRSPMIMETLVDLMKQALETHRAHRSPAVPQARPTPETAEELLRRSLPTESRISFGCIHCHYVRESHQNLAVSSGSWSPDQFWIWPPPPQVGLVMNQQKQYEVESVIPNSPADLAGILPRDRIVQLGPQRVLTKYDIQWILNQTPDGPVRLNFETSRGAIQRHGTLQLAPGWRVGDPDDYLWRIRNVFTEHMEKFLPTPGALGTPLDETERQTRGIGAHEFHLRVNRLNSGAYAAGLRLGDIILSANQRSRFQDRREFYLFCETVRQSGRDLTMGLLRDGTRMQLRFTQATLNEAGPKSAPEIDVGFMPQELPLNQGLRIGNVVDHSSAERSGLRIGDRILEVGNVTPQTAQALKSILNRKSPGDLLSITVSRGPKTLSISYLLPRPRAHLNDLAHLSEIPRTKDQILSCRILLRLPREKHIYSAHKVGFGIPTQLDFRGKGFECLGGIKEPTPTAVSQSNLDTMWILCGTVEFEQLIRITNPDTFHLYLKLYAQVCDDRSCHELTAVVDCDGRTTGFHDYPGDFESQTPAPRQALP